MPDPANTAVAGVPFDHLIAAPLISAAKASAMLATTTSDFIEQVGNRPPLRFTYTRHVEEPDEQLGGSYIRSENIELSLPVLGAVSVPNLRIDSMTIVFNLEVRTVRTDDEEDPDAAPTLHGKPSALREHTRASDTFAKYSFDIRAVDGGTPEALARIIDLFSQTVAPVVAGSTSALPPLPADSDLNRLKRHELNERIDEINRSRAPENRLSKGGTNKQRVARIRAALSRSPS